MLTRAAEALSLHCKAMLALARNTFSGYKETVGEEKAAIQTCGSESRKYWWQWESGKSTASEGWRKKNQKIQSGQMEAVVASFRVENRQILLTLQQCPHFCTLWHTRMPKEQPPAPPCKDQGTQHQQEHQGPHLLLTWAASCLASTWG